MLSLWTMQASGFVHKLINVWYSHKKTIICHMTFDKWISNQTYESYRTFCLASYSLYHSSTWYISKAKQMYVHIINNALPMIDRMIVGKKTCWHLFVLRHFLILKLRLKCWIGLPSDTVWTIYTIRRKAFTKHHQALV